jgi:hypothetical protein
MFQARRQRAWHPLVPRAQQARQQRGADIDIGTNLPSASAPLFCLHFGVKPKPVEF